MMSVPAWFDFQEKIKDYFLSIGANAETNKTVKGVRTRHDIDVYIQTRFLGEDMTWVVEAKHWKSPVSKLHVLALRTIVDDIGVDRGFIVSSAGFQNGALEAADKTNVRLKTFDELKKDTSEVVESEILKSHEKRLRIIEERYWSHSKTIRIQYGLRHDIMDFQFRFTGQQLLMTARKALQLAKERHYPIDLETFLEEQKGDSIALNFQQFINWLNLNLNHFEEKIFLAEAAMFKNGDYSPRPVVSMDDQRPCVTEYAARAMAESERRMALTEDEIRKAYRRLESKRSNKS